jgi:hypothetical protein
VPRAACNQCRIRSGGPRHRQLKIVEEEREIHEGTSHGGMSAVINLTGRKP